MAAVTETDRDLADRLAAALAAEGATVLFGLPGGGPNLDVLGAAERHGLRFVLAHAETPAAVMAGTYGLLTGAPAPMVVTRGPGAASVTNGLAQATLDRFPLVVVADTVPEAAASRVAHQRLDQRALLAPAAKVSATISNGTEDDELRALVGAAARWPYGGVHLDYDPSADLAAEGAHGTGEPCRAMPPEAAQVDDVRVGQALERVAAARRPVLVVGMEAAALPSGPELVAALAAALACPVLTTYQAVGVVPTEGPANAGLFTNGALEAPVLSAADLIVTVGLDLVEPIPAPWPYPARVVRLSGVAQTDDYLPATVDVVGDLAASLRALVAGLAAARPAADWPAGTAARFRDDARLLLRTDPGTRTGPGVRTGTGGGGGQAGADGDGERLGPVELVDTVARHAPAGLTVTVDAGAHFLAVLPQWPVDRPHRLLISNGLATMGFALPAAIGAALARPGEPVLALTGDGGLSMVLGELETAARLDLPVTVVVFNDAALSLIEIKQRPHHGGPGAVRYRPTDFAAIARASGLDACAVTTPGELAAAVADPDGWWRGPRLIDARVDPAPYRHLIAVTRG